MANIIISQILILGKMQKDIIIFLFNFQEDSVIGFIKYININ
jgi:hypothetical protein